MKLILVTDDGDVLDTVDVTIQEWQEAKRSPLAAQSLLHELTGIESGIE